MHYQPQQRRVVAHFGGGKGIHTFDLRKMEQLDYYNLHYYQITDYDIGTEVLSDYALTAGAT